MAVQRSVRPALVLAGGALTLALTAACQGQATGTVPAELTGASSNGLPECGSTNLTLTFESTEHGCNPKDHQLSMRTIEPGTGSATVSPCHAGDLAPQLGRPDFIGDPTGLEMATVSISYENVSQRTCTMQGYAGVALRGPADPNGPVDSLRRGPDPQLSPTDPRYVATPTPMLVTLPPGGSAHTVITFASNTKGSGQIGSNGSTTWTPTQLVCAPPGDTASWTMSWPSGVNVFRQDSATISATYIGPVEIG